MEKLPVEVIHRIFDNLDAETILFSIRSLSRLFRSVVSTYNRFTFNAQLISKSNFYVLCRLIKPENIISLILSNDERTSDQIDLFISLARLRQFTRLRSLTLLDIDEAQLNFILKRINHNTLTSFTFTIKNYDRRRQKTTNNLLSSILAQPKLHQLKFDINETRISESLWQNNCSVQSLTIKSFITMNDLLQILQSSPHLHTIIIENDFEKSFSKTMPICSSFTSFPQLTSLTIEKLNENIDRLESFLSLTPSLIYLKLVGGKNMMDGKRWEQFIQTNLSQLNKFEFYFNEWCSTKKTLAELELILASFRTPFWIEHKKWFITGEYRINDSSDFHLYSIPICKSFLTYRPQFKMLSLSTDVSTSENNPTMMNNVKRLTLILDKRIADDTEEKKAMINCPVYVKVTEIDLHFYTNFPVFLAQSLSAIINITQIVQITLESYSYDTCKEDTLIDIRILLEQAHNLSSLIIESNWHRYRLDEIFENMYSAIPRQLKHLQIPIDNLDQMKMVLERCDNLSTIKIVTKSKLSMEIINWFNNNTINSTCTRFKKTVNIWIGKKNIQSSDDQTNYKRIKLSNHSSDSEMF